MSAAQRDIARRRGRLIEMQQQSDGERGSARGSGRAQGSRYARVDGANKTRATHATDGALALMEQPITETEPGQRAEVAQNRILLVEDDPSMVGVIQAALELEGEPDWNVQVAVEGLGALELASATPPDVVLLDVQLPGLDGAEVYRRLREGARTSGARILFLTAGTSYDLVRRGIQDGVLLRKPFDVRDLVSLVRALLAG